MTALQNHILTVLLAILRVGGGPSADETGSPLTVFDNFHVIEANRAYRSDQINVHKLRWVIRKYDIRVVVNLRGEKPHEAWYRAEKELCDSLGVRLVDAQMSASELPQCQALLRLYDTFTSTTDPILIHCKGGADRTGAASAIWRILEQGVPNVDAAEELAVRYGHFKSVHPQMDDLVTIFRPDRGWIEMQYPDP